MRLGREGRKAGVTLILHLVRVLTQLAQSFPPNLIILGPAFDVIDALTVLKAFQDCLVLQGDLQKFFLPDISIKALGLNDA